MRRSASPSKTNRSGGAAPRARGDDSSAVLKTPFKPLSGLDTRRTTDPAPSAKDTSAGTSSSTAAARDVRTKSIEELQDDLADTQLVLNERLTAHNAARRKAKLPEQTPEQIVEEYISLLTQYNKVKDAAQVVFDKIADIEQLPAKDIHARYGVGESASQG